MYYRNYERLRDERGVTDYRVATDTKISRSVLSEWKGDTQTPSLQNLKKIADYFNVTLDEMTQEA